MAASGRDVAAGDVANDDGSGPIRLSMSNGLLTAGLVVQAVTASAAMTA